MSKNLRERLGPGDPFNAAFISSVDDDERLVPFDIQGSIAHTHMLQRSGLLTKEEGGAIQKGLEQILAEWEAGRFKLDPTYEDVHMNVEHRLSALTPHAGKLHTGRSRNDQIALDLRLWMRVESDTLIREIRQAQSALVALATKHKNVIMPGITHLQHAQPIHFAHAMLAYHDMLERDARRIADAWGRADVSPLGAGALAGSSLPIDPDVVANELGFSGLFMNSIDAVGDRSFCAELVSSCVFVMMHLSQMAEMLILWSTPEFGFVELPNELCTSSSLMPQKKNPDMVELVRGRAGSVIGAYVAIMTTLKGLPLGYNRDLQETKRPMFESADTTLLCLKAMTLAFQKLILHEDRMNTEAGDAQMLATDLAEYLVKKGVAFREAHGVVGRLTKAVAERGADLSELGVKDLKKFHAAFEKDVLDLLSPQASVRHRTSPGGTGTEEVHKRLAGLKERNHG